jgi:Domain of unknown function (DUF6048)
MQLGARHLFFSRLVLLCLAMLLGVHATAWATTLGKKSQGERIAQYPTRNHSSKIQQNNHPPHKTTPATPDTKGLKSATTTEEDPLVRLDALVVQQHITQAPYVPVVQTIGVAVDYGRLAMNLFTKEARRYTGSISILFRKNMQLSGTLGYQKLAQERVLSNQSGYTVAGYYGSIGLDYFAVYNLCNNLYAGLRYSRSGFKNSTTPASPTEQIINKNLTASWWELVIGSEHQLFYNFGLYAGLVVHLKGLGHFEQFTPATNYVIPGYGRNVQPVVPALTLYVKYQISFLEKQITFDSGEL